MGRGDGAPPETAPHTSPAGDLPVPRRGCACRQGARLSQRHVSESVGGLAGTNRGRRRPDEGGARGGGGLAACGESQRFGLDRIDRVPYTGQHGDGQETGGWSGSSTRGWCGGTRGEHGRHRCDGTGSERGDAEHRAAGHGRILRGFRAEFGGSVGGRDTDAGGSGSSRPVSEEQEDVEQRVEIAAGLSELTSSTGCLAHGIRSPSDSLAVGFWFQL